MYRDLVAHKGYADAELLNAVRQHDAASSDPRLRTLLHHTLMANRYWLLSILGEPFADDEEMRVPDSLDPLIGMYRATHDREMAWLATATEAELARPIENARIPGSRCLVSQALLQVCLHSQGHRAQCARMLRALGGAPTTTDFILWLVDRPAPRWPA